MTITNVKATVAKVLTVGLLAGAFVMAAPAKADAEVFGIGIHVGAPAYGYDHRYHDDHIRREEIRHDDWGRGRDYHDYRGYRHNAPYWYR
jgi:hypothetical protein